MSDRDAFDGEIERLFARTPAFDDTDAFAERVGRRLNRNWGVRTGVLTGAGVAGGFFAVREALGAGLNLEVGRVADISSEAERAVASLDWAALSALLEGAGADMTLTPAMPLFWLFSVLVLGAAVASAVRADQGG